MGDARLARPDAPGGLSLPLSPRREVLHAAVFAAMVVIWGTTFLAIRVSNAEAYDPLRAVVVRLALAAIILLGAAAALRVPWPRGTALKATLAAGFLFFGLNFPLLYWGELTVNSGTAAVLWGVYPVLVALGAPLFLAGKEPLTARGLLGGLLACIGLAVVFWSQLAFDAPVAGFLAVLGGITVSALGTLTLKRWAPDANPAVFNGLGCALGALLLAPVAAFAGQGSWLPASALAWASFAYLLVAGSLLAFPLWAWLLRRWPATRLSFQTVLSPLIAVALGVAVLGEALEPGFAAGTALVLAGTYLAVRSPAR